MKYIALFIISVAAIFASCESLEDTYSDYSDKGRIRYLGKTNDIEIKSGWKRFEITWGENPDPTVKKVKIVWSVDDEKDSVTVDAGLKSYNTESIFNNKTYAFDFYSMDESGRQSLKNSIYARPFTEEHEDVAAISRIERKHFFVGENLIMFFNKKQENITDPVLTYYSSGVKEEMILTEDIINSGFLKVANVDLAKEITIKRSAEIEGCLDVVDFTPYELNQSDRKLNTDFKNYLAIAYNIEQVTDEIINETKVLYLDRDLMSLEDVLYFPNLEKIVIGGKRYMAVGHEFEDACVLTEMNSSVKAIEELILIKSVEVEVYNNHYNIGPRLSSYQDMGNPVLPSLDLFDTSDWTISCTTDQVGYNSHPERLIDNDVTSKWQTEGHRETQKEHSIIIDMKEVKSISGFLARQDTGWETSMFAESVHIQLSSDNVKWSDAVKHASRELGGGKGETTLIELPYPVEARYVKVLIKDRLDWRKYVLLADFMIY